MSRASNLKDLVDELRGLYDNNFTEQEAYDQLKDDPRLNPVRFAKISAIYKQFKTQRKSRRIQLANPFSSERLRKSTHLSYYKADLECNHKKNDCLKFHYGGLFNGRFYLLFDRSATSSKMFGFSILDTFSNKKAKITIDRDPEDNFRHFSLNFLSYDLGLLIEHQEYNVHGTFALYDISLIEFDWETCKTHKIHSLSFEHNEGQLTSLKTHIDSINPGRFILETRTVGTTAFLEVGDIQEDKIVFEEKTFEPDLHTCDGFYSLVDTKMYNFYPCLFEPNDAPFYVTNLEKNGKISKFKFNEPPKGFSIAEETDCYIGCMGMERIYLAIKSDKTGTFGIMWASEYSKEWTLLDFCVKKPIINMTFVADENLILVQTLDNETKIISNKHRILKTFYRVPLKKPDTLSALAWFSLVRSKRNAFDPYKEASKYLPFNSTLRCPFDHE
jgi:hypothetical protein